MVPEYGFDRHKLPKGRSFPLARSVLDDALASAAVRGISSVYFWKRRGGPGASRIVLRADYCGEGRVGWAGAGSTTITVYDVASTERKEIMAALVQTGLPRLIQWLTELDSAGNTVRGVDKHFVAEYVDGKLQITTGDPHVRTRRTKKWRSPIR